LKSGDFITVFSSDLYRPIRFATNQTVTVEQIELLSFALYDPDMENATLGLLIEQKKKQIWKINVNMK